MSFFPTVLDELIERFASLPGIGIKSAQRLAFHILSMPEGEAEEFANTIIKAKSTIHCCKICQNLTDKEVCAVCEDQRRDHSTVCVVADPKDVAAIERTREYDGSFHVLHGVISPMNNIGPDDIKLNELVDRVASGQVKEIIMATNPDTEGETTAKYIARLLKPFEVRVTRLAYGIPVGGNLEFADDATLSRAIEGRTDL